MNNLTDKKSKALKMMLWFGIGSLIMTFAGLTSAFIVSKNRVDWVNNFPIPAAFYFSLFVIIISSLSLLISKKYLIENKKLSNLFLVITIVLGLSFILLQFTGFNQIIEEGDSDLPVLRILLISAQKWKERPG